MVTINDLRDGYRPFISEAELAELLGCSRSTLQKRRHTGLEPEFLKDPETGKISYSAAAVLKILDRPLVCKSTADYVTTQQQERLAKARDYRKQFKEGNKPP